MSTKLKLIVAGETAYDRGIFCVGISDSPQDAFDKLKAAFSWCECYWVALGRPDPPVSDGKWITFDIDGLTQKRVNEAWIELSK